MCKGSGSSVQISFYFLWYEHFDLLKRWKNNEINSHSLKFKIFICSLISNTLSNQFSLVSALRFLLVLLLLNVLIRCCFRTWFFPACSSRLFCSRSFSIFFLSFASSFKLMCSLLDTAQWGSWWIQSRQRCQYISRVSCDAGGRKRWSSRRFHFDLWCSEIFVFLI